LLSLAAVAAILVLDAYFVLQLLLVFCILVAFLLFSL
jgi:hypothetical protein